MREDSRTRKRRNAIPQKNGGLSDYPTSRKRPSQTRADANLSKTRNNWQRNKGNMKRNRTCAEVENFELPNAPIDEVKNIYLQSDESSCPCCCCNTESLNSDDESVQSDDHRHEE